MRLLPPSEFSSVFSPLCGLRCGVVDLFGNPGDRMLQVATRQLLSEFGVQWRTINPECDPVDWCDRLLLGAGGNMGLNCPYHDCQSIRATAVATGVPCVVLPQTFWGPDHDWFHSVYVRDWTSLEYAPGATLAPDLALGLDWPKAAPPKFGVGVFLRQDFERCGDGEGSDPVEGCWSAESYMAKAAQYSHIVTNRLHFAIAGLILDRRVTLLPGGYHKNRSVFDTWLSQLGCEWSDKPPTRHAEEVDPVSAQS